MQQMEFRQNTHTTQKKTYLVFWQLRLLIYIFIVMDLLYTIDARHFHSIIRRILQALLTSHWFNVYTWKLYTKTLNFCRTIWDMRSQPASQPLNLWLAFDLERSKLWRWQQMYDMFFAFTYFVHLQYFFLGVWRVVVFNSSSAASRSSSHCHCIRFYEKGCFSVIFFFSCILLLLLFLLLLFCRRQNSYLLFQCLVECQQEGVSTAFFPHPSSRSFSKTKFLIRYTFFVVVSVNATWKLVQQSACSVDIHI